MDSRTCDVLIVGSGPGGASTAALLAEAGLDVLLVEEGEHHAITSAPSYSLAEMNQKYRAGGLTTTFGKPNITYIEADGRSTTLNLPEGWSLMQGATANGIEGILGECGGSCACATCHCYVDEARLADLPAPSENELAMLENVAAERRANSRLACQIKAGAALEGLTVTLPDTQE